MTLCRASRLFRETERDISSAPKVNEQKQIVNTEHGWHPRETLLYQSLAVAHVLAATRCSSLRI
jgi:hypothetical protein